MVAGALTAALAAAALTSCAASTTEPPATSPAIDTTTTTEPEPVPVLSEVLGFIEISVRIGLGESAEVVALAVDAETLDEIPLDLPSRSPAWCSGSLEELRDLDTVEEFEILLRAPAVDETMGGAQQFSLAARGVTLGDRPVPAEILLISDGIRYEVAQGELDVGETFTSGTFRGTAANGIVIEGAFLCG